MSAQFTDDICKICAFLIEGVPKGFISIQSLFDSPFSSLISWYSNIDSSTKRKMYQIKLEKNVKNKQ